MLPIPDLFLFAVFHVAQPTTHCLLCPLLLYLLYPLLLYLLYPLLLYLLYPLPALLPTS
ncbi:MAG: hypothetical protein PHR35_03405 [Kiritimatiellae bacterium]|nr:hypothetical protein [Kiritimatiellia bacterium]